MVDMVVYGAAGRMGRSNIDGISLDKDARLSSAIENKSSPFLGKDAGIVAGCGELGIVISDDIGASLRKGYVVIDFTTPYSTLSALSINLDFKKAFVIGTTGFTNEEKLKIKNYSKEFPIVFAPNFSIGVNVLFKITEIVAKLLNKDKGYDLEMFEAHHRFKKDSPSGTALRLAEIAMEHSGRDFDKDIVHQRNGIIGERGIDEAGMHVMRAGDIIGEHKLSFCTLGERVQIEHIAHSRKTFSKGAILAAKWIAEKKSGIYSMQEVLGI